MTVIFHAGADTGAASADEAPAPNSTVIAGTSAIAAAKRVSD
ncbi:MAG TPA: hypothetical protein VIJ66_06915 [Solirubrobacteraceae bacterium]